jgi:hypothetical protein
VLDELLQLRAATNCPYIVLSIAVVQFMINDLVTPPPARFLSQTRWLSEKASRGGHLSNTIQRRHS